MILVTGAAGFIGFHTSRRLLNRGELVLGIDSLDNYYDPHLKLSRLAILDKYDSFHFVPLDLSDLSSLEGLFCKWDIKKVCHLAAQAGVLYSFTNPFACQQSNLEGFINIIETSRRAQVENFVYASSSSVYGNNPKVPFVVADRVDTPASLYGASKRANELIAYTYSQQLSLSTSGLRFFTVYGPWGRPDMAYFKFTRAILEGKEIDVYGHGKMERDFTYIDDITDGILKALDMNYKCEIFNLGYSKPVNLEEFISILEDLIGKKAKKHYHSMPTGDVPRTWADIEYTAKMLAFEPKIGLKEGLSNFVSWYQDYHKISLLVR